MSSISITHYSSPGQSIIMATTKESTTKESTTKESTTKESTTKESTTKESTTKESTTKDVSEQKGYSLYEIEPDPIGQGSYATVYKAFHKVTRVPVAIKTIDLSGEHVDFKVVDNEVKNNSALIHDNIAKIVDLFVVDEKLWVIMPLHPTSIFALFKQPKFSKGITDFKVIATILKSVLKGLEYIHSNNVIHRDIKASNILLDQNGIVKIADFGISCYMNPYKTRKGRKTFAGTPCWMAPEILKEELYTSKADIWSLGITALEIAFGQTPTTKFSPLKILITVLNENAPNCDIFLTRPEWNEYKVPNTFKSFISKCLRKDPEHRHPAKKLLTHKFIRRYASEDLDLLTTLFH